ncbi:MAG TPA: PDZ domain-containing protein, partial [Planctomycetota bacterium]|nr:PDZ domain-containing protein [Planctomycetota bacterium]
DAYRGLDRWFQEEHQMLRNLERRFHAEGMPLVQLPEENRGAVLGVLVAPVTDSLRSQLKLGPHEGLVVAEVEKGSLAERSGLQEQDILVKISGQGISGDAAKFREQVMTALHAKEFTLDLIRGGERRTLTVHPGSQLKG